MSPQPTEANETVSSVMHTGVVTCRPDASLRSVARLLAEHRIHAVVVTGPEESGPSAVVTDRDVVFAHARGQLDSLTARDAASAEAQRRRRARQAQGGALPRPKLDQDNCWAK